LAKITKASHEAVLVVNLPSSTQRYFVLTVWARMRLNRATVMPEVMHTNKGI